MSQQCSLRVTLEWEKSFAKHWYFAKWKMWEFYLIPRLPFLPLICFSYFIRGRGSSETGQALQRVLKRFLVILQSMQTNTNTELSACRWYSSPVWLWDRRLWFSLDFWLEPRSAAVQHLLFYCVFCMIHCHNCLLKLKLILLLSTNVSFPLLICMSKVY